MTTKARAILGVIVIVAAVGIAYLPAARGGFVWDDDMWVVNNPLLAAPDGMWRIWFSQDQPSQYFPLVYTTFRWEHALWGLDPMGYHLTNVLLHAINALLVWLVLARMRLPAPWLGAMIFALHPVHVESVAWITERKNVLLLLFLSLSFLAWLRFLEPFATRATRRACYLLSLALYLMALLSKTTACTFPAALVLSLWMQRAPLDRRRWLQIAPYVALGVAMGLVSVWWERHHQGMDPALIPLNVAERTLLASRAIWFYLGKLAWPADLSFSYTKWTIDAAQPLQYGWLVLGLAAAGVLAYTRRWMGRGAIAALVFFVATLLPMLGFILLSTFAYAYVADHYQYVASIGPIALFAALCSGLASRFPKSARIAGPVLAAVLFVTLGTLTWRQTQAYESVETLWRDTLAKYPDSWLAHNNLGTHLRSQGRIDDAIGHYVEALKLKRDLAYSDARIRYNLGNALAAKGDLEGAAREYRRVVAAAPNHVLARNNLGNVLLAQGRIDEAIDEYARAVEIRPTYAEGHLNLGNALRNRGRIDTALVHYREAARLRPEWPEPLTQIAFLLASSSAATAQDVEEAVALAERAAQLTERRDPRVLAVLAEAIRKQQAMKATKTGA